MGLGPSGSDGDTVCLLLFIILRFAFNCGSTESVESKQILAGGSSRGGF